MTIPFHPLADLFPLMEGVEFDDLVTDVKANGLRDLVMIIDQPGGPQILDGRNRYRALLAAGLISPEDTEGLYFRHFVPAIDKEPLAYVLSKNLARRHLNESQRAMVAERLANMHVGRPRIENGANLRNIPSDTSIASAAKALNVSPRLVNDARIVKQHGTPELNGAVDRGKLTVTAARQASKLTPEIQHEVVKAADEAQANVVRTVVKQKLRAAREEELGKKIAALPDKQYGVVLADPEWEFVVFSKVTGMDRSPANHYPTNPVQEIAARDVQKLAAKDCMLALWSPCSNLERALTVMRTWGFEYKTMLVWVKDIVVADCAHEKFKKIGPPGLGYWFRDRAEILLIGTRGEFVAPAPGTQIESIIFASRPKIDGSERGKHSAKPDDVHRWIEANWPHLPKIELNARVRRHGWDSWGNELADETIATQPLVEDAEAFVDPPEEEYEAEEQSEFSETEKPDVFEIPAFLRRKWEDA